VTVPPTLMEKVVREEHETGIDRVWLQQGAESQVAIQDCQQNGMSVVNCQCILLYAQPMTFFHMPHRWAMQVLGQLSKSGKDGLKYCNLKTKYTYWLTIASDVSTNYLLLIFQRIAQHEMNVWNKKPKKGTQKK
jgi:hypothetical protein